MLVTNLLAWPTSSQPREKKRLAPRRPFSKVVYLLKEVDAGIGGRIGSCCFAYELKGASAVYGRPSTLSDLILFSHSITTSLSSAGQTFIECCYNFHKIFGTSPDR